jgi:hypothetical protein
MATAPFNPLTYTPLGQTPPAGTGTTSATGTGANREGLYWPAPKIGSPMDLKGAGFGKMNQGMNAIFNGTIKTKSGEIIPNVATQIYNMMGGEGGTGTGTGALSYTPGAGGGLTSTPTTPAAGTPTTTPTTTPAASPSQPFGQRLQQFMGGARPQGTGQASSGGFGDMFGSGASASRAGTPKWKQLMSSALSR